MHRDSELTPRQSVSSLISRILIDLAPKPIMITYGREEWVGKSRGEGSRGKGKGNWIGDRSPLCGAVTRGEGGEERGVEKARKKLEGVERE